MYKFTAVFLIFLIALNKHSWAGIQIEEVEDNDFAEFEDFEEDTIKPVHEQPVTEKSVNDQHKAQEDIYETDLDSIVEDEDNEFEHFQDEEEFEGFDSEKVTVGGKVDEKEGPKITIAKVPLHFRTNWNSFYLEMLMIAGLLVYFINFFSGKTKNSKMASVWYSTHKSILEENFSLVGDDGKMEIENRGLIKESEHLYTLWCSGRTCCEGMLVELKFLKRQDLVAIIAQMMKPTQDQIHIKVDMNKEDMDTFVFCVASKKTAVKLSKDMADLSVYCVERRGGEKMGLPSQFQIISEMGEVTSAILDSKITALFNRHPDLIDFIHFSDQYSGPKQTEETNLTKLPSTKKVLMFGFNIPTKDRSVQEAMDALKPLMNMVFYCMDKIKRYRLSKEGKNKADKNRLKVEEAFLKTTHAARAEAAAARREQKRRQEKERILQEDDPEKQRKWEEKEMKRQMKKKAPKMKQLKH
ncbi:PAT complex subunit CCDC47 isoform X2 [Halyomorpha halys]|uniref:PAT complex subunit CCDC47 isoform X2 n=1 Tax=Halyomorpha halys TaxID=286706 RepID=UPI0006D4F99E|nr:coiled-coil domain-containing protein 47 isoform X2 [Halyomorpha halys]